MQIQTHVSKAIGTQSLDAGQVCHLYILEALCNSCLYISIAILPTPRLTQLNKAVSFSSSSSAVPR